MLSTVLNSDRAIEVNIQIMRAFVKLREMIASNKELAKRLDELESKYDEQFTPVSVDSIRIKEVSEEIKRSVVYA